MRRSDCLHCLHHARSQFDLYTRFPRFSSFDSGRLRRSCRVRGYTMEVDSEGGDDAGTFIDVLVSRLSLQDSIESEPTTSKNLSNAQRTHEHVGWTPGQIEVKGLFAGRDSSFVGEAVLQKLLRSRSSIKSPSNRRLWWVISIEILKEIAQTETREDQAFDEFCSLLVADLMDLSRALEVPDRDTWADLVHDLSIVELVVATRSQTLMLATRALFDCAPAILLKTLLKELQSSQTQNKRSFLYWLALAASAIEPKGRDAPNWLSQILTGFSPTAWSPLFRKSDFRQSLGMSLTLIVRNHLGNRDGTDGHVDRDTIVKVDTDVNRWIAENEKKQASVGLPLRGALHGLLLTQPDTSRTDSSTFLLIESRVTAGLEQKLHVSILLNILLNVLLGASSTHEKVVRATKSSIFACMNGMRRDVPLEESIRLRVLAQCLARLHVINANVCSQVMEGLIKDSSPLLHALACNALQKIARTGSHIDASWSAFLNTMMTKYVQSLPVIPNGLPDDSFLNCLVLADIKFSEKSTLTYACSALAGDSILVRSAARRYLSHAMQLVPNMRCEILKAISSCILNLRALDPASRLSAMTALSDCCEIWNGSIPEQNPDYGSYDDERVEAAALLMVCDADHSVRTVANEALKKISKLHGEIGKHKDISSGLVASIVGKHFEAEHTPAFIRSVSEEVASVSDRVYTTVHAQAYQRIQAMMVAEGDGKMAVVPIHPSEYRYKLWQHYMLFVCSGNDGEEGNDGQRKVVILGHRGSILGLLDMVIPRLAFSVPEVDTIMRLFLLIPEGSKSRVLDALLPLQSGLMKSTIMKRRHREDVDMVIRLGQVYQSYAQSGVFSIGEDSSTKIDRAIEFVLMVCSYLKTTAPRECDTDEVNQMRFAVAIIVGSVLDDTTKLANVPAMTQKELWENFQSWQEGVSLDIPEDFKFDSSAHVRNLVAEFSMHRNRRPNIHEVAHAAREALAALSASGYFTRESPHNVISWANKLVDMDSRLTSDLSKRVLLKLMSSNTALLDTCSNLCYSSSRLVSSLHLSIISDLRKLALEQLGQSKLFTLVLYNALDEDQRNRSSSIALLDVIYDETELSNVTGFEDEDGLLKVCQHFVQMNNRSAPEVVLEVWNRQKDEFVRVSASHTRVMGCLVPLVTALHLPHMVATGNSDKILQGLYFLTNHAVGTQWDKARALWMAIGSQPRNVAPAIRFLRERTLAMAATDFDVNTFRVAKAACGWLSATSPQQVIDQLVYTISFRALESDENDSSKTLQNNESQSLLKISSADVGIILLSELAIDHCEDFRFHLPVLAHAVSVTLLVANEPTVKYFCGELLCNLASKLAGMSIKNGPAYKLARLFLKNDAGQPWSAARIRKLVEILPLAIDLDENLRQRWSGEARRWILRSSSFSLARASAITLMALDFPLDDEAFASLLSAACSCASISEEAETEKKRQMGKDLTCYLLKTMSSSICAMNPYEVLSYAQVFWCGVMCLRTRDQELYASAIDLCFLFLTKCPIDSSPMTFDVITSCAPLRDGEDYPELPLVETYEELLALDPKLPSPEISIDQLILLIIKGLFIPKTFVRSVRVLAILAPHIPKETTWNGLQVIILISYLLVPLILATVEMEVKTTVSSNETRTIAHRLAQSVHGIERNLSSALRAFANAGPGSDTSVVASLEAEFMSTLLRRGEESHLPLHCLREFSLCADAATARKMLFVMSKLPKSRKTFSRDLSRMWSDDQLSNASTMSSAAHGVLLSARLEIENKNAVPSCIET